MPFFADAVGTVEYGSITEPIRKVNTKVQYATIFLVFDAML